MPSRRRWVPRREMIFRNCSGNVAVLTEDYEDYSNNFGRILSAYLNNPSSFPNQLKAWGILKTAIKSSILKVDHENVEIVKKELLAVNILRGKGIFCRYILEAQRNANYIQTRMYASLVAGINEKVPAVGKLLLTLCIIQFKDSFSPVFHSSVCFSSLIFIVHLIDHNVSHHKLAVELVEYLTASPTDYSLDMCIYIFQQCGVKLFKKYKDEIVCRLVMLQHYMDYDDPSIRVQSRISYLISFYFSSVTVLESDEFSDEVSDVDQEQTTHCLNLLNDSYININYNYEMFTYDPKYELNEKNYFMSIGIDELPNYDVISDSELESDYKFESDIHRREVMRINDPVDRLITLFCLSPERQYLKRKYENYFVYEKSIIELPVRQLIGYNAFAQSMNHDREIETRLMFLYCCADKRTFDYDFGIKVATCTFKNFFSKLMLQSGNSIAVYNVDIFKLQKAVKFFAYLLFTGSISWKTLYAMYRNDDESIKYLRKNIKLFFNEYIRQKRYNDPEFRIQAFSIKALENS